MTSYSDEMYENHVFPHLFGLLTVWDVDGVEKPQGYTYSCFAIEHESHWFLTTAGHCLKQIDEYRDNPAVKLRFAKLVDCFRSDSQHKDLIPFSLPDQMVASYVEDFLDVGCIPLNDLERDMLRANSIQEFKIGSCFIPQKRNFDFKFAILVGLPDSDSKFEWDEFRAFEQPWALQVFQLESLNDSPRVTGTIDPPFPIVGMSGGPIVGFYEENGTLYSCPIAIQGSWLENENRIFAHRIDNLASALLKTLESAE